MYKCLKRSLILSPLLFFIAGGTLLAEAPKLVIVKQSANRPLASLEEAGERARAALPKIEGRQQKMLNFTGAPKVSEYGGAEGTDPVVQKNDVSMKATSVLRSFEGTGNDGNVVAHGVSIDVPDTDGDVGPNHFVQMINIVTTIFDKNGLVVAGPFPSNALWQGAGGLCELHNMGDPLVVYDEANDRWLLSQLAFDNQFNSYAHCVAVSQTGDPAGAYNRYEFNFDAIGFPDYPKLGIVSDSITMTAKLFNITNSKFLGTYLGVLNKAAMYAGQAATIVGQNIGKGEIGFLPVDLDDANGSAGSTPGFFATAMSQNSRFDIWQATVDWLNPASASFVRVARLTIASFDADLCNVSREACVSQCNGGQALTAFSNNLMSRLKIVDFGTHKSMVASHTVDAGGGRAGIRWYEFRLPANGSWGVHQQGTYAPNDGLNRWMSSIAINAAGNIGLGYLVSGPNHCLGSRVNGQTTAASGTGILDSGELDCRVGVTETVGSIRAGDYSATNVDPVSGSFWHTNEYGERNDQDYGWATTICEFEIVGVPPPPCTDGDGDGYGDPGSLTCPAGGDQDCNDGNSAINPGAAEICDDGVDNDCDGDIDSNDSECVSCGLAQVGESCGTDSDCCSGSCSGGKPSTRVCL